MTVTYIRTKGSTLCVPFSEVVSNLKKHPEAYVDSCNLAEQCIHVIGDGRGLPSYPGWQLK